MLKLYKESEEFLRATPPPPTIVSGDSKEYEVETILDKRTLKGKTQYLIKWIGYPLHDATWEPANHLKNAKEKVKEYEVMRTSSLKEGIM
jgi:hypothetical protein